MISIIHLSDLHFGTELPNSVDALREEINHSSSNLVIISGDLTQRAKPEQFKAARDFIKSLNKPVLCIPGNHDIPLYNIFMRAFLPYYRYRKFIHPEKYSFYNDENLAIIAINSATPYKPMGGYVRASQLARVKQFFKLHNQTPIKIVVMHHNLIRSERHKIINQAEKIINLFAQSNVNLVLCGHIHQPLIELLKRNYLKHNMYVITAGTAISNRTIAPNSFNLLEVSEKEFTLVIKTLQSGKFIEAERKVYPL